MKKKILVVDDDYDIRKMVEIMLYDLGHIPIIANNSKEAMNGNYHKEFVDLLITDYQMPWPDGLALVSVFKKKNIPAIVMSANRDIKEKVLSLGGLFLEKPFDEIKLKELIDELLKGGEENVQRD